MKLTMKITMKKINGFTLIEMMVVITLVGILISVAIPSFQEMIKNNRSTSIINTMQGSLMYAKGEAITIGQSVSLCKRDGANGGVVCDNTQNWEDGWIVFRDVNANGVIDAEDCTTTIADCTLRLSEALKPPITLRSNGTIGNIITFNSRGFAQNTGVFSLCDNRGASKALGIKVALTGTLKRLTDTNADGINDDSGTNITCP